MGIAQRRGGGGPRFNDDMVNAAMIFAGALLVIFFLLVIRLYLDRRQGPVGPLSPQRSPAKAIQLMLKDEKFGKKGEV
jgi:hypothetical protein